MPRLTYSCVLTRDVKRLGAFYSTVLQLQARQPRATYMEFDTPPGILGIWSLDEYEQLTGISTARGPAGGSVMLEFQVDDVDAEYLRLADLKQPTIDVVMQPTTLAWGNRSIYFRDPDGNLINFFTPVA
jgi:catechol 2,3-dioxygenase-like lactoylglutathione lyase family enzyme